MHIPSPEPELTERKPTIQEATTKKAHEDKE